MKRSDDLKKQREKLKGIVQEITTMLDHMGVGDFIHSDLCSMQANGDIAVARLNRRIATLEKNND